jgi:parallel beta-helix repeat protein
MLVPGDPAAFMSYARFNDEHDDGQLSAFRERLSTEVRAQTGEEFPIFQDRKDIAWGQSWQQRIDEALDAVTLLLVIITPGLFRSPACRAEVARFLDRERALGRQDLILPVYYISARQMDDPGVREGDELARVLAARQFADWRELRFEAFTAPVVRKAIAQLAGRMRDAFWLPPAAAPARLARAGQAASSPAQSEQADKTARVIAKTEPPTHVVDAYQRGDFATVGAAIAAAKPGDRIVVRPGLYEEGLIVDKPLEILGDGPVPDIEIRARGADALLFKASIGRVANLTLRQAGGDGIWYGADITQGRLDLEGCDISSQNGACVGIHDGADPRLRRNQIHHGKQNGVFVYDDGQGTLEDNDISGNALAGVEIKTGGDPTLRRNKIHDGKAGGVYVHDDGRGTLEDNDITGNARSGVEIRTGGDPTLRRNKINRNEYAGVSTLDGGRGTLEDNDLTGNARGAWDIAADCRDNVTRARNKE